MIEEVFDKSNWSGEEGSLIITDPTSGEFVIDGIGDVFTMTEIENDVFRVECKESDMRWHGFRANSGLVYFYEAGTSREDDSAYVAFAQLAYNIF